MGRAGRGGHHVGRRKRANQKRAEREKASAAEHAESAAEREAARETRRAEVRAAQHAALSQRGLLGIRLRDSLMSGVDLTQPHVPVEREDDPDQAAYARLRGFFQGRKRRRSDNADAAVHADSQTVEEEELGAEVHIVRGRRAAPHDAAVAHGDDSDESVDEDGDADETDEREVQADADAESVGAAGMDDRDGDAFVRRFLRLEMSAAAAEEAAKLAQPVSDCSWFRVPQSALGVGGLDAATGVRAAASARVGERVTAQLGAVHTLDAAALARLYYTDTGLDDTPLPPVYDLASSATTKAWLSSAWLRTYGCEPHTELARAVRSQARRLARSGLDVPEALDRLQQGMEREQHPFTPLQWCLWGSMSDYRDIYFAARTHDNARELRTLTAMHVLNHAMKARDCVAKNEARIRDRMVQARIARLDRAAAGARSEGAADEDEVEYRDQGFTRPRVLILLPTRHVALQYVRSMLRLLGNRQIMNKGRFFAEFAEEGSGLGEDADADGEIEVPAPLAHLSKAERQMMSDVDDDDVDEEHAAGEGTADAAAESARHPGRVRYAYDKPRQGWSAKLRRKMHVFKAAARAAVSKSDSEDDSETSVTGSDSEEAGARLLPTSAEPLSALAQRAGRAKQDDRIVKSTQQQLVFRGRRQRAKKSEAANKHRRRQRQEANERPEDFVKTFTGNIDDDFRMGIGVARRSVKLYADFFESDMIVASPLGLRRMMGAAGDKDYNADFLSSIEVLVMDGADVLLQQNWQHVQDVLAAVNVLPRSPAHTDFSRVRQWDLDGLGRYFRQTIVYSAYAAPEINHVMRRQCVNITGALFLRPVYAGTHTRVLPSVRQVFQRVDVSAVAGADDARLAHFRDRVLPELAAGVSEDAGGLLTHTLIYAPTYMDYVVLRNAMDRADMEFLTASEYSEDKDIARARAHFLSGLSPILLMSERFHFFRRYRIRGARHILFYGPPSVPWFYDELVNTLGEASAAGHAISVTCLYTHTDALALARVCGEDMARQMLAPGARSTHYFV